MILKVGKPRFRSKVALWDFDWTLVCPKGNKTFPKDVDDWQWLRPNVPEVVRGFYKRGFGIYIVTNQTKEWKREQILKVAELLEVPLHVCIAWQKEERKPGVFLFEEAFSEEQRGKIKKVNLSCVEMLLEERTTIPQMIWGLLRALESRRCLLKRCFLEMM